MTKVSISANCLYLSAQSFKNRISERKTCCLGREVLMWMSLSQPIIDRIKHAGCRKCDVCALRHVSQFFYHWRDILRLLM